MGYNEEYQKKEEEKDNDFNALDSDEIEKYYSESTGTDSDGFGTEEDDEYGDDSYEE